MPNRGRSAKICEELVPLLQTVVDTRGTVSRIWHPIQVADAYAGETFVWVRPVAKTMQGLQKRETTIEVSVTARLPKKTTSAEDPYNAMDFIDELDHLSEELARLFLQFDPDKLEVGDTTAGTLAEYPLDKSVPVGVDIPVVISPEYMQANRQYLSVFTVKYQISD